MIEPSTTSRRTGRHIPFAVLLVLVGLFVLGHTVVATRVTVRTLGWSVLVAGIVALLAAVLRVGHRSVRFSAVTGALFASLGIVILGHPETSATTLTLVVGAIFLGGGVLRLVTAADDRHDRALLVGAGVVSIVFGVLVLSDPASSSLTLLGRMVGLQITLDGVSLLLVGRLRAGLRDPRRRRARRYAPDPDAQPT